MRVIAAEGVTSPPPGEVTPTISMTSEILEIACNLPDTPPEEWSTTQRMALRLVCLWLTEEISGLVSPAPTGVHPSGVGRGARLHVVPEPPGDRTLPGGSPR